MKQYSRRRLDLKVERMEQLQFPQRRVLLQPEQVILFGLEVQDTAQPQDGPVLLLVAPDCRLNFNLKDWEAQARSCLKDLERLGEIARSQPMLPLRT